MRADKPLLLPAGMRDLLPHEAWSRRALARLVLDHVALAGYELVLPPVFELADVLERGLGTLDPRDVLRFVEPESGEIAALRPDMTPQIARMAATRLRDIPPPVRLAYEGTVFRRRQERARRHRQIPQAGLELLGVAGPEGDCEILALAASAIRAAGITKFVVDVGHADVARSLLDAYPAERADALREALGMKDEAKIAALARCPEVPDAVVRAVTALPLLHGGIDVLDEGERLFAATPAAPALAALRDVVDRTRDRLGDVLSIDLGEVRGFAYYTGLLFHVLADGPGEAIGGGGRYDDLLSRFGWAMPAAGFALDLDHLAWARRVAGVVDTAPPRVAVSGNRAARVAEALRARGIVAAIAPSGDPKRWARASRYAALLADEGAGLVLEHLDSGTRVCHAGGDAGDAAVAAWIEARLRDRAEPSEEEEEPCRPS